MAVQAIPAILAALAMYGGTRMLGGDGATPATPSALPPAPTDPGVAPDVTADPNAHIQAYLASLRESTAAAPRPASPVLSPGAAQPTVATPDPTTTQAQAGEAQADASSQTQSQAPEGRGTLDRLQDFGYAMAASRNPSLFGMIGDAGLAMRQGDQQARREALQSRELDTTQEYRQAQISLAQAEAAWQRDPNNPLNVARLAQARAAMLAASRGGGGGGGSGSARRGPAVPIEMEGGRLGFFYPQTGETVQAPEGARPLGAASRTPAEQRLTQWQRSREAFISGLARDPLMRDAPSRAAAVTVWESANPRPAGSFGGTGVEPTAPAPARQRYDISGRPIP